MVLMTLTLILGKIISGFLDSSIFFSSFFVLSLSPIMVSSRWLSYGSYINDFKGFFTSIIFHYFGTTCFQTNISFLACPLKFFVLSLNLINYCFLCSFH